MDLSLIVEIVLAVIGTLLTPLITLGVLFLRRIHQSLDKLWGKWDKVIEDMAKHEANFARQDEVNKNLLSDLRALTEVNKNLLSDLRALTSAVGDLTGEVKALKR